MIVLTRHPRAPLVMAGGNTFYFVDASPAVALEQARTLAGGLDVRIGGGVQTIREFLQADLIDEMHLAMVPIILGRGERLWDGLEGNRRTLQRRVGLITQRRHPPDLLAPLGSLELWHQARWHDHGAALLPSGEVWG